ncbi:MAG: hypothetical protein NTX62_02165 [Deltaproteobacteria bacterium]|nr:hypothetical protein [Deltaproteobacteria bacterium]
MPLELELVPVVRELLPELVLALPLVPVAALPPLSSQVLLASSQEQRDILSEKGSERQRKEWRT